jgi:hypothetical protein
MTQGSVEGQTEVVQRLGDHWYVGGSVRVNDGSQGAIWRSADGRDWGEPSLLDPEPPARPDVVPEGEIFFPEAYRVSEIAEWQGSLYAFGWHHFGCCDGTLSMLWRSEDDGVTWAEVNTEGTAYSGSHFPIAWWVAGDGSLALYSATGLGGSGSVFMTSDMETWREYPIQVPDDRFMTPYTAAGGTTGGLVVGVEYTYPNGATAPEEAPVMWQSTDGRSWSLVAAPPAAGQLDAVAWDAEHEQFVVIGKDAADQLTAWRSTDLRTWSASSMAGEPATVVDLAAADGVIAAIGSIGAPGGNIRTTAWTSYDADVWWVSRLADGARGGQIGVTLEGMVAAVSTPSGVEGQTPTGWDAWAGQFAE